MGPGLNYQQEFLATCRAEAEPLLFAHWQEIALNKNIIPLAPDWDAYEALEAAGVLRIFTARESGRLVGYFACFVRRHLHYRETLFAVNDVLFLTREHRKGWAGPRLIRFAEKCLKADGVTVLAINTKRHRPFDLLLKRMNYTTAETVYQKVL